MATIKHKKEVSVLPAQIEADTLYFVRVGTGFDLYLSDMTGSVAHKVNDLTGSGGVGGADTELQYNNAGALAGATKATVKDNNLTLLNNTPATSLTQGQVQLFCKTIAGRDFVCYKNINNQPIPLHASDSFQTYQSWECAYNDSTVFNYGTVAPKVVGTARVSRVLPFKRLDYLSAAKAGALSSWRTAGMAMKMQLGFFQSIVFANDDAVAVPGRRAFYGISSSTAAPTNVEPSTLKNSIGVAQLSTDTTQYYLCYSGSVPQTPIPLGKSLGATTNTGHTFALYLYSMMNSTNTIFYEVANLSTGVSVAGTLTGTAGTALPTNTTLLYPRAWACNNAQALAVKLGLSKILLEAS